MVEALLAELRERGIRLRLVDGRLDVHAPAGSLTPELRDRLLAGRDQLLALLSRTANGDDAVQITPRPDLRFEPFPLTDIQHAYWVGRSNAVELGGVATHYYFELDSTGLDLPLLNQSLNAVISRQDMLRAIVQPDGRQRVLADVPPYRIEQRDLRSMTDAERDAELATIRAEMGDRARPPDNWPLFDVRASVLDDHRLRLHFSFNLLIIDYFSLLLLFADWRRTYVEPDAGRQAPSLAFRDYVSARESVPDSSRFRKAEAYWLDRLSDLPPAPDLPLAKHPSQVDRVEFVRRQVNVPAERWAAIKHTARERGLTPSAALMTAFADVLRSWSRRQGGFTLNLTLFERPPVHPAIGEVIGDFTSLTMLAVEDVGDLPFAARAQHLNNRLLQDLEHTAYSGVRVLRERARSQGSGLSAAMPVVFTSAIGASRLHGADDRSFFGDFVHGISQTPQVWLDHQVMEEEGELVLIWDAVDELFPAGMLDDMFAAYCESLDHLSTNVGAWDEKRVTVALPKWQLDERQLANDTATEIPARTLSELVEDQIRLRPDATAVATESAFLTYSELADRGYRLARLLSDRGAGRNRLVGVVLDRGWEQAAAVFGVTRAGAAYLPIDPQWPQARRWRLLERGQAALVVTTTRLRDELEWPAGVDVITFDDAQAVEPRPPEHAPSPDDLAYVIFTSGSTGEPKGVVIDHRGAANTIQDMNARFGVGPDDRVLALSSLSFDLSVYDIFGVLAAGGTIVAPSPARAHDPDHWTDLMRRHGVTVWNSVPALMQAWVDSRVDSAEPAPDLRLALLSGDWIPVRLPDAVRKLVPAIDLVSLGGATEASIWSVHYPIGDVPDSWTRIPYGKPLANQTLHVYDSGLEPCPVWAIGEIHIGGVGVAKGYWADPEQTAERFIVDPTTGQTLYRTGDLGRYLPGGDIELLGREDFQVKLNGYRIELEEIAAALRRQPGVTEALARVVENPVTGRRQLVAYLVGTNQDAATLREAAEALLPSYMVPQHYLAVDAVPLSANGKVDTTALPTPWDAAVETENLAPRDDLESALLAIWHEVLERDDFGVADNFFELGADSLHAVRILGRLHDELGFEQDEDDGLQTLFENPTIAELAATLRERGVA